MSPSNMDMFDDDKRGKRQKERAYILVILTIIFYENRRSRIWFAIGAHELPAFTIQQQS